MRAELQHLERVRICRADLRAAEEEEAEREQLTQALATRLRRLYRGEAPSHVEQMSKGK